MFDCFASNCCVHKISRALCTIKWNIYALVHLKPYIISCIKLNTPANLYRYDRLENYFFFSLFVFTSIANLCQTNWEAVPPLNTNIEGTFAIVIILPPLQQQSIIATRFAGPSSVFLKKKKKWRRPITRPP